LKVLKDLNFIDLGEKMHILTDEKEELFDTLLKDSMFLASNNLMDYSLLFIKIKSSKRREFTLKNMPAITFNKEEDGNNVFVIKEVEEDYTLDDNDDIEEEEKEITVENIEDLNFED
jgi:hypothetical protein